MDTPSSVPSTTTTDRLALEEFVVNNPQLHELEALLAQFNIFEALGAVRQELRHTDFLSFLLNPSESHGLGDYFTKRFVQKALLSRRNADLPLSLIQLDVWNLQETRVLREWGNVDIVLENRAHQFVVLVENKIDSSEHSAQLQRYRTIAERHYPDWRILYLFLTPEGDVPSDDAYIPIDYRLVCSLIEELIETRSSTLGPEVRTLALHYAQMLRRHIVSESSIEDLCRQIYQKHQRALDLLFEYRPDLQAALRDLLEELAGSSPGFTLDQCSKTYIRFIPKEWDSDALRVGERWTKSGRMLLFEFKNHTDRLSLSLIIGPGPADIRRGLFSMAESDGGILRPSSKALPASFCTIYTREFLHRKDLESASIDDLQPKISKAWENFLEHDLPRLDKVLSSQSWIWSPKAHPRSPSSPEPAA